VYWKFIEEQITQNEPSTGIEKFRFGISERIRVSRNPSLRIQKRSSFNATATAQVPRV